MQRLSERFWFIPAVLCVTAFVAAEVLIASDRRLGDLVVPDWLSVFLYQVGESGSRDILGAIASSSLAVAGTTFSITMAVLALTSSTYGPRLVRNFMADRGNQAVLGVYVSTFLYSLLVLRSIRVIGDPGNQDAEVFVPHLAVNAAVFLGVVNVAVLIYFIHHISDSIQVSTIASTVRADLLTTIDRLYPAGVGRPGESGRDDLRAVDPAVEVRGAPVTADRCGYVQSIRDEDLMNAARRHDVLLALQVRPGQYVLQDTVVVLVDPPDRADDRLIRTIRSALRIADARSPHQDPEFAVQQLTEMAVRALSPGTNDPYTAVNALDDLSAGLVRLAERDVPSPARLDAEGVLRVHAPAVGPEELIASVVDSMRWYAATSPPVMHATLGVLQRVGECAKDRTLRGRLAAHVDALESAFLDPGNQRHDVDRLRAHAAAVRQSLAPIVQLWLEAPAPAVTNHPARASSRTRAGPTRATATAQQRTSSPLSSSPTPAERATRRPRSRGPTDGHRAHMPEERCRSGVRPGSHERCGSTRGAISSGCWRWGRPDTRPSWWCCGSPGNGPSPSSTPSTSR